MSRAEGGTVVEHPIVFYDGDCGLCDRFVRWMLRRDRRHRYRFAPLQGDTARRMIRVEPGDPGLWSVVLVDHAGEHRRSTATLRAVAGLGGVWRAAGWLLLVPAALRDPVYRLVARHRYRWFGRAPACALPGPEERGRFLP
jgi:predicted DCC family thiol-disulfide oxidoreductase YuxK